MRTDLQRLKRDSESGRHQDKTPTSPDEGGMGHPAAAAGPHISQHLGDVGHPSAAAVPHKKRWPFIAAAAVVVIAGLVSGGPYCRSHQSKPLTDKDTIVVADFDNKTGDVVFDDTLKTALTVALNQSPFLNE